MLLCVRKKTIDVFQKWYDYRQYQKLPLFYDLDLHVWSQGYVKDTRHATILSPDVDKVTRWHAVEPYSFVENRFVTGLLFKDDKQPKSVIVQVNMN